MKLIIDVFFEANGTSDIYTIEEEVEDNLDDFDLDVLAYGISTRFIEEKLYNSSYSYKTE